MPMDCPRGRAYAAAMPRPRLDPQRFTAPLTQRRMDRVLNVAEMREHARRLPRPVFDAIDGGAGDEVTLRANRTAFDRLWIRPRALADVGVRDLTTTVLGQTVSMPILVAPCAFGRMAH